MVSRHGSFERLVIEAKAAGGRGDHQAAIHAYNALLTMYPKDSHTWGNLGRAHMLLGQNGDAADAYERSIALDSLNAVTHLNLATSLQNADQALRALRHYLKAFDLAPRFRTVTNINHAFGGAYVDAGDLVAAEDVYSWMADGNDEQRAQGLRSTALLRMYTGRYDDAIDLLRRAVGIDLAVTAPATQVRNLNYLAAAHLRTEDTLATRTVLTAAQHITDSVYVLPFIHARVGVLLARIGEIGPAQRVYEVVMERVPETNAAWRAEVHTLAAEIAISRGELDLAISEFQRSLSLWSSHVARRGLAAALTADRFDEAVSLLQDVIAEREIGWEAQEEWILAHYDLGRLYEANADEPNALRHYRDFLDIWSEADPDILSGVDARRRVAALTREAEERS